MTKTKWAWLGMLALLYVGFWSWYGGNGDRLTEAESERLLARLEQTYGVNRATAPPGSLTRNLAEMVRQDDGREFYAVNLETRKQGQAALVAEAQYTEALLPILLSRGGHPVFVSERVGLMLGEYGRGIDRVAVVRYRSLRDLLEMAVDPAMPAAGKHKFAALAHTEVFITRPTLSFVQVRLLVGLVLLVLAWAGLAAIDRLPARRANNPPAG